MTHSLTKHTLHLREGDYPTIREAFPAYGAAFVIRNLVSSFVDKLNKDLPEEEAARLATELATEEVLKA